MSPFWRALLVGEVLVALVLLAQRYGRSLRDLASAVWPARHPLFGRGDVLGVQWLMAIGALLLGAVVLLAILVALLLAPPNGVPTAQREAAPVSSGRLSTETPYPQKEQAQNSDRVAPARAEARESRQREPRAAGHQ